MVDRRPLPPKAPAGRIVPRPVEVQLDETAEVATRQEGTARVDGAARGGRGTLSNATGRYERHQTVAFDDGWEPDDEPVPRIETQILPDKTRTIIARNDSPDISFDRSINPYRGCEHGCTYCFARPSHAYLGFSPGIDFESRILVKPDAARLLEAELGAKSYECRPIAMGTNTDPYQPVEKRLGITRSILEVLERWNHPVTIVTKSALIQRDIDILARMASRNLAKVALSITTLDRRLARRMEPRAATPDKRLETIQALSAAGIPTGVMTAPMIPGLNDHELEAILEASAQAGATAGGYVMLRLPLEIKDLFEEWLAAAVPDRAARVMALVRQMRGGKAYDSTFGLRQRGSGPYAELIGQRFRLAAARLGLDISRRPLDLTSFRRPLARDDQMALFGD